MTFCACGRAQNLPAQMIRRPFCLYQPQIPLVVETTTAHGWSSGDMVYFIFDDSQAYPGADLLFLRQFVITKTDSTHFSIADPDLGRRH